MSGTYKQSERIGELKTPLGTDRLVLTRFSGHDGVSELFEYRVEAISEKEGGIDFDGALGRNCTVTLKTIKDGDRHFVGTLTETQALGKAEDGFSYLLVLRPWLWMLSRRTNSLIFHNKSAPTIIGEIFDSHGGIATYDKSGLTRSYPELEYCVQHRESDMDFVCRLMEAHGISYYFKFEDGKQTMVLADRMSGYQNAPGKRRNFYPVVELHNRTEEHVYSWIPERRFTSGKAAANDYNFIESAASLLADREGDAGYDPGKLEVYQHPYPHHVGEKVSKDDGNDYAQAALDSYRAVDGRSLAAGDCAGLSSGMLVDMAKLPEGGEDGEYLVLRASHDFAAEAYRSGGGGSGNYVYRGSYEFMSSKREFAPPATTPRPFVAGTQTARVIRQGDSSDEIDVDKYGRILVHFHWDRSDEGKPEGKSMRCRVAQVWAGPNWGGIFLPRVGMEVLVQYIDGNPDRPIVVGCVYNDKNMPPYPLPNEKDTAGWKSRSTPMATGYNEIALIDTADDELVRFHAQRDLDSTILNDERRTIKHDRETQIDHDDTLNVDNEIKITAAKKITITVGSSTIVMEPTSIKISSISITVTASGDLTTEGSAMATHTAGGPMTINGMPVKIN